MPRSEMSGLLLALRFQYKVAQVFPEQVGSVSTLGDSTCVISAMDKNAVAFNLFMHARISKCISLLDSVAQNSAVEKIEHIISSKNITDLCSNVMLNSQRLHPDHCGNKG